MRCVVVAFLLVLASAGAARAGEQCGPNFCGEDSVCCNYGCGICVPKNDPPAACIALACPWGKPEGIAPLHTPAVDAFNRAALQVAMESTDSDLSGISARGLLQLYLFPGLGLHASVGGSHIRDPQGLPDQNGFFVGLGLTYVLPRIANILGIALVVDGELSHSALMGRQLAFFPADPEGLATLGAGLALADLADVVPVHAHVRWLEQDSHNLPAVGAIDTGIGVSFDFKRVMHRPSAGVRVDYRLVYGVSDAAPITTHELSGGVYWSFTDHLRLGLDVIYGSHELNDETGSDLTLGLSVDWYLDRSE